jgi:hypothetical protein
MVSALFFYQLVLVALVWLCVMLHWAWPSDPATVCPTPPEPPSPRPQRHHEPTTLCGPHHKASLRRLCARQWPSPTRPLRCATALGDDARTPPSGRYLDPLLSPCGLCVPGLGGLGPSPCQWPSQWGPLAAVALHRLSPLLLGEPRDDLSWEVCLRRPHRACHCVPG